MKKTILKLIPIILLLTLAVACGKSSADYLQYKNTTDIEGLVSLLPYNDIISSIETDPDVVISYDVRGTDIVTDDAFKNDMEKNAYVVMALMSDVDKIKFRAESIVSKAYSFESGKLNEKYSNVVLDSNTAIDKFLNN